MAGLNVANACQLVSLPDDLALPHQGLTFRVIAVRVSYRTSIATSWYLILLTPRASRDCWQPPTKYDQGAAVVQENISRSKGIQHHRNGIQ